MLPLLVLLLGLLLGWKIVRWRSPPRPSSPSTSRRSLTGASLSFEADAFFDPAGNAPRIGQAFIALSPERLAGQAVYFERVETMLARIAQDPEVRLPGARREALRAQALAQGVAVRDELLEKLHALARPPQANS